MYTILLGSASAALFGVGLILFRRFKGKGVVWCQSKSMMNGKTVIITGANCGIGNATAQELCNRGARVILACRDLKKAKTAANDIRTSNPKADVVVQQLDLASLESVHKFCDVILKEENRLDILINNAGIFRHPNEKTVDGFEIHFAVNHLGHFLLTNRLLGLLKASGSSRIVIVSSSLHKRGHIDFSDLQSEKSYNRGKEYSNTKLANNLFARELHHRINGDIMSPVASGVSVHCLHPGVINTLLSRYVVPWFMKPIAKLLLWLFLKTPLEGCQTTLYCAISEELENVSGGYYGNCKLEEWTEVSKDDGAAKKLWEISEKLAGLDTN